MGMGICHAAGVADTVGLGAMGALVTARAEAGGGAIGMGMALDFHGGAGDGIGNTGHVHHGVVLVKTVARRNGICQGHGDGHGVSVYQLQTVDKFTALELHSRTVGIDVKIGIRLDSASGHGKAALQLGVRGQPHSTLNGAAFQIQVLGGIHIAHDLAFLCGGVILDPQEGGGGCPELADSKGLAVQVQIVAIVAIDGSGGDIGQQLDSAARGNHIDCRIKRGKVNVIHQGLCLQAAGAQACGRIAMTHI